MAEKPPLPPKDVLFEIRQSGAMVRVSAIDAESGIEAVLVGPAAAGLHTLKTNALRKLAFVIERERLKRGR
ncbi:DUF6898 family protein [Rhodospirillum rubrum]|uniref:DUF6898 domain-containing protein n=1 Tax=Rhodospirillum rubrum (strain ATCC 11170 / ATH 1.1.1 / DSM 467 / LMG 4362 / NCIMB 8255 / S1) TaxID=269796 RepID=Q2RTB5_RHORT|nr:hypothetical protein [Rhodospirillum rubrum]ABC22630.1 hypothetical protein Rru_A1830 [Rhodospirillum rubrum ATCC 11170]AEO48348.1 hypothetical protein F11_09410 [Rhodospirillum rubrum F11]MBK5954227.1 hypothetical protein [Rhodospirillum rubrum]QXG82252.1 hypothetical protein KUL73_09475 [Rhodospirillum rubrum]HAP99186.1 hypothetical protein [Rhodospirillum rubrum]